MVVEIWWRERDSYPHNLAWIHAAVSEKLEFTDDGRTDGGRLHHDIELCLATSANLMKSKFVRRLSSACPCRNYL